VISLAPGACRIRPSDAVSDENQQMATLDGQKLGGFIGGDETLRFRDRASMQYAEGCAARTAGRPQRTGARICR